MYDEQKAMHLANELGWRLKELQDNTSDAGDWRIIKAFEDLLSSLSGIETDATFVTKLREWVDSQAEDLKDGIEKRVAMRTEINDIEIAIAENV